MGTRLQPTLTLYITTVGERRCGFDCSCVSSDLLWSHLSFILYRRNILFLTSLTLLMCLLSTQVYCHEWPEEPRDQDVSNTSQIVYHIKKHFKSKKILAFVFFLIWNGKKKTSLWNTVSCLRHCSYWNTRLVLWDVILLVYFIYFSFFFKKIFYKHELPNQTTAKVWQSSPKKHFFCEKV